MSPSAFDAQAVREQLAATRFAHLRYVQETDSTNDDAAPLLGDPAAAGTVLLAEYQRHGRGRRGRRWLAAPGSSLLFSAILPEPVAATALWAVPFWCALAVAEGVEAATGAGPRLQWPNDLLLETHKACGILCVSRVAGDVAWAAAGIGLNVRRPAGREESDPAAAYLSDVAPGVSREAAFVAVVAALGRTFDRLRRPQEVAAMWERRAGLPGASYRIQVDGEPAPFDARALRLGPQGELVVDDGTRERGVALGEARVLR